MFPLSMWAGYSGTPPLLSCVVDIVWSIHRVQYVASGQAVCLGRATSINMESRCFVNVDICALFLICRPRLVCVDKQVIPLCEHSGLHRGASQCMYVSNCCFERAFRKRKSGIGAKPAVRPTSKT